MKDELNFFGEIPPEKAPQTWHSYRIDLHWESLPQKIKQNRKPNLETQINYLKEKIQYFQERPSLLPALIHIICGKGSGQLRKSVINTLSHFNFITIHEVSDTSITILIH